MFPHLGLPSLVVHEETETGLPFSPTAPPAPVHPVAQVATICPVPRQKLVVAANESVEFVAKPLLERLALWAACSGVDAVHNPLLHSCGPSLGVAICANLVPAEVVFDLGKGEGFCIKDFLVPARPAHHSRPRDVSSAQADTR